VTERNVIAFLQRLAREPGALATLQTKTKEEVLAAAAAFGHPFTDAQFDWFVWALEERLAARRGEAFDQYYSLWETMWGRHYLTFLVQTVVPSITEDDIDAVLAARAADPAASGSGSRPGEPA
jgi:hypothetical protein